MGGPGHDFSALEARQLRVEDMFPKGATGADVVRELGVSLASLSE